jgi:hypothetical protein
MRATLAVLLLAASVAHAGTPVAARKPKAPEQPADSLSQVNALTKLLAPNAGVAAGDLERLIAVAEGVALRDAARQPTPATIIYASAVEQAIRAGTVKGEHATAVLAELALALVPLTRESAASFYPELLTTLAVNAKDAKPRPELGDELRQIGAWGERTVTSLLKDLPSRAPVLRMRLAVASGHAAEAVDHARAQLSGPHGTDPRWHAWLAAALLAAGQAKEAESHLSAARGAGGEAARIARDALDRATWPARAAAATRALAAAGVTLAADSELAAACLAFAKEPKGTPALIGAAVVACADVRFVERSTEFLAAAAKHAPPGLPGQPLRAANGLRVLFDAKSKLSPLDRKVVRTRFLDDVPTLAVDDSTHKVLKLLAHLATADNPTAWEPGAAEGQLLTALDRDAPCESASFALRAMATRNAAPTFLKLLDSTVKRCAAAPAGSGVTHDAIQMYLQLSYDTGAALPEEIPALAAELAAKRPDDAGAIAAHADAIALKALAGKRAGAPLEAALSRYEDAIAHTSPAADPAARQRLESNAAYLSVLLGQLAGDAAAARRAKFYERAAQHLRLAIAFGETPPLMAVRAQWDIDRKSGKAPSAAELAKHAPGPLRARAACTLARQAAAQGNPTGAKALLAMVKGATAPRLPELSIDTVGVLEAVVDGKGLRPEVALHARLLLLPACDPGKP